jgi:hypothetical protein
MKRNEFLITALLVLMALGVPAQESPSALLRLQEAPVPDAKDYGILFWRDGIRGTDSAGRRLLCLQTGTYGAVFDVDKAQVVQLGAIKEAPDYSSAAAGYNRLIDSLPEALSELVVRADGKTYRCVGGKEPWVVKEMKPGGWVKNPEPGLLTQIGPPGNKKTNCRILDYGQYYQAFEVDRLRFETDEGESLDAVVRLVVTSWPDRLSMKLELIPSVPMKEASAGIGVRMASGRKTVASDPQDWSAGAVQRVSLVLPFGAESAPGEGAVVVSATDTATGEEVESLYEVEQGVWKIRMNNHPRPKPVVNGLDRYTLRLANSSDQPQKVRLVFAIEMGWTKRSLPPEKRGQKSVAAEMGGLLVLRDEHGSPSGTPLQNSHNWVPERQTRINTPDLMPWIDTDPMEYGSWNRYATVIELPPQSEWSGEAVYSHALWGGIPQASFYYLSLYGWGYYTFWDVAIQGSFGESLCYSLESFADSDIADLRPLYVTSYDSFRKPPYEWTPNLGGANYLHYKVDGRKQYLNTRRVMPVPGPCLTRTGFHGRTEDQKIAFSIRVEHPRTDDINRVYHHIRYDVLEDTGFSQLAFFQMGTTAYDFLQPGAIAWGSRSGLQDEVEFKGDGPPLGRVDYFRRGMELAGSAPWWVSQHQAKATDSRGDQGQLGLASRGMVVREWKAVLNGQRVESPTVSLFGTHHRASGMLAEIGAPEGVTRLRKGDYVEMLIEVILVPKYPEHYLGTNEALKKSLPETADTWKAVHRQAVGNDIQAAVSAGTLEREYPVEIRVDESGVAEFELTGGLAYLPVTFTGVKSPASVTLVELKENSSVPVDQSDHGNDFWQAEVVPETGLYRITYNLHLDTPGDQPIKRIFRFVSSQDDLKTTKHLAR